MNNPKTTPIVGKVVKCTVKTAQSGKDLAEIHVEAQNKKRDGTTEKVVYIMTAFSYHQEKFKALREGDEISAVCNVTMDTYKPEWPKVKLIVESIEVLNTTIPQNPEKPDNQPTASETKELAESMEDQQLPF